MTERIGAGYSTGLGYSPFFSAGNTLANAAPHFSRP
jgi:hypothetical protein